MDLRREWGPGTGSEVWMRSSREKRYGVGLTLQ